MSTALRAEEQIIPLRKPRINWSIIGGFVKFWAWTIPTKAIMAIIYGEVISGGLRNVMPELGKKLWKVPGFSFLELYEATYRIDLAHVFAVIPLIAAFVMWYFVLMHYLTREHFEEFFRRLHVDVEHAKKVVVIFGVVTIVADACLFFASFVMGSWGSSFSPTAFIATLAYVIFMGFTSFVSLLLANNIQALKKETKE